MRIICVLFLFLILQASGILADEELLMSTEEIAANLAHYGELAQSSIDPPEMSLEALAAGVEHYNSLIRTGRGTLSYFSPQSDERTRMTKVTFTFDGRRMRTDILEGLDAGRSTIYDGEVQITIQKRYNRRSGEYDTRIAKGDKPTIDGTLDPRSWYQVHAKQYLEEPLEKRLRASNVQLVGKEPVDGKFCYVVNESGSQTTPRLLWICPEMGFRVVKAYTRSCIKDRNVVTHRRFRYKAYEQKGEKVWFPKRVEYVVLPSDSQGMVSEPLSEGGPNVLTIYDDFEINPDVSSFFEPRFPSGTMIFDVATKGMLPVEQILPEFVEP